jgi:AcrR family transcriptional regulator
MTSGQSISSFGAQRREPVRAPERQQAKRGRIIAVAMKHFAVHGYEGTRVEAVATEAGVSKGAVFSHFASNAGLFFSAYQAAARSFSKYLERGEVRRDTDAKMIVSLVNWLMDRCQDAMVTEELDPGPFGYHTQPPEVRDVRLREFVELLRGAVGMPAGNAGAQHPQAGQNPAGHALAAGAACEAPGDGG